MTIKTPIAAPYPILDFLKPSAKDQSENGLVFCSWANTLPCSIPVHVGLFFDTANNAMERKPRLRNSSHRSKTYEVVC